MDFVRLVAILAVIVIHVKPFTHLRIHVGMDFSVGNLLNQACRFAVPFFFVMAGFFWASKFSEPDDLRAPTMRLAKRLAFIFIAWSIFYLIPTNPTEAFGQGSLGPSKIIYLNLLNTIENPGIFIQQGTKLHLWFLVSLLCALAISALLIANRMLRTLLALALVLYLIGLSGMAYADTPIGFHSPFNLRNGPFFSLIFFVSGYLMQRIGPRPSWFIHGLSLVAGGTVLHFTEFFVIKHYWGTTALPDYLLGTYCAGIGVAMIALSDPPVLRTARLSPIAPLILGIYAVHFAFVDLLRPLDDSLSADIWWGFTYPAGVFLLSLATVFVMSRYRLTRGLVS